VEKRPSRHQHHGKTIMEKARERKKKANLDGGKGNAKTYNPFSILSNHDLSSLVEVTCVKLWENEIEVKSILDEMQDNDCDIPPLSKDSQS
jgi:hypothetical protein